METTEKKKGYRILDRSRVNGTWQLTYGLVNDLGIDGFSGRMLDSYPDALTGKERHLVNMDNRIEGGLWIDKQITLFQPATNAWHERIVDWLVGHPLIWVDNKQTGLNQAYIDKKPSNPKIKLVNLDHQNVENLLEEDFIDKLVGTIVLDNGPKAIGLEKLRWILAKMNHEYREAKYINDPKIEKQQLRRKLKTFVRSSIENAKKVDEILEKLEEAKFAYEIKEMLRLSILSYEGAMFMYNGHPIGTSFEAMVGYFNNNPELYADLLGQLAEKQRIELM